jgi:hypothetical protein
MKRIVLLSIVLFWLGESNSFALPWPAPLFPCPRGPLAELVMTIYGPSVVCKPGSTSGLFNKPTPHLLTSSWAT